MEQYVSGIRARPDYPPDEGDASDVGRPPFVVALYLRPSAAHRSPWPTFAGLKQLNLKKRCSVTVADRDLERRKWVGKRPLPLTAVSAQSGVRPERIRVANRHYVGPDRGTGVAEGNSEKDRSCRIMGPAYPPVTLMPPGLPTVARRRSSKSCPFGFRAIAA